MSSPSTNLHYTAGHPPTGQTHQPDVSKIRLPTSDATSASQQPSGPINPSHPGQDPSNTSPSPSDLPTLKQTLQSSLTQYPDFPAPGILFEDILPLFSSHHLHTTLINALEQHVLSNLPPDNRPDIIIALEARGFLFGPTLALRLGAGFVPVRKPGKLPGVTEKASCTKEYGEDAFQIQTDAIRRGQKVLVVDDVLATGGSAAAAGELVEKVGGVLLGYVFILELAQLNGRQKLGEPVHTLLSSTQGKDVT